MGDGGGSSSDPGKKQWRKSLDLSTISYRALLDKGIDMKEILVLGKDDAECDSLFADARAAAEELGKPFTIQKVTDPTEIMMFGVTLTPAVVINDGVRAMGRVPSYDELMKLIDMVQ